MWINELTPPITKKNYQKVSKKLRETARDVAESSMLSAVKLKKMKVGTYIGVSVDGTWQIGVFSSRNGVVVAVSTTNFKAVNVEIISRYCQPWTSKEELRKTDKIAFNKWKIDHEASCKANYKGSAGSMEATQLTFSTIS